jgi:alcohol dehydrogenase (cytochrome c)
LRAITIPAPGTQNVGSIYAISVSTGKTEWKYEQRAALLSLVSTAGGLLFGGDVAGRFRAFDQRSGKVLWQTNLGSQVTGFPISYAVGNRQYIAVSTGQAVNTAGYLLITPEIHPSENYALYVFALPEGWETARSVPLQGPASSQTSVAVASAGARAGTPAAPSQCRRTDRKGSATGRASDGLFSTAQRAQGQNIFIAQQCSLCHGVNLQGSASAPALADAGFRAAWQGRSLGELFDCMKGTMPPGRAGTLPNADYVQLLAAILAANGFAAAAQDNGSSTDLDELNRVAFGHAP